ncbi:MAG TPA: hypothetical protein VML55_15090 [Planctomycetaceae bacterium]|nr:hypothetical protein [Planctomycetaceae bacterium]
MGKPPWITARIQRGEMPLRDVLRSAGLEPGMQPLTPVLRCELAEECLRLLDALTAGEDS